MNVLEEWARNPVLETLLVEVGPVDPHCLIVREVMDTVIKELVRDAEYSTEGLTYVEKYG